MGCSLTIGSRARTEFRRLRLLIIDSQDSRRLGCEDPARQLFGCDIDPASQSHLVALVGQSPKALQHFAFGDFLTLDNERFGGLFDVVLGNPPYVSHHNTEKEQKLRSRSIAKTADCSLPATASMWAYFSFTAFPFSSKEAALV